MEEAFAILDTLVIKTAVRGTPHPQDVGLSLLPVVESIDGELVHETLWHVLSLSDMPRALTAACVARYDRDMATQWLPPDMSDTPGQSRMHFFALAQVDPEASVRLAKNLPELNEADQNTKMRAWTQIVAMLRRNAQARWEWMQDSQMNLWYVGKEDI